MTQISGPEDIQKAWIKSFNEGNIEKIKTYYAGNSGIYQDENLRRLDDGGLEQIQKLHQDIGTLDDYSEVFYTEGRDGNVMSLGYLKKGKKLYSSLIAWRKVENNYYKEFETILEVNDGDILFHPKLLSAQRRNWEKFSNAHDPAGLIRNVYTSDAYYFNRGQIDQNREKIIDRYQYMANPNWKIRLEQRGLIPVSNHEVLEIGNFYSGGEGQYLLIWEKTSSGDWQIKLDFNF
jgi:ketosteroid isomerase-like protein